MVGVVMVGAVVVAAVDVAVVVVVVVVVGVVVTKRVVAVAGVAGAEGVLWRSLVRSLLLQPLFPQPWCERSGTIKSLGS
jgi:hypothetical protein